MRTCVNDGNKYRVMSLISYSVTSNAIYLYKFLFSLSVVHFVEIFVPVDVLYDNTQGKVSEVSNVCRSTNGVSQIHVSC